MVLYMNVSLPFKKFSSVYDLMKTKPKFLYYATHIRNVNAKNFKSNVSLTTNYKISLSQYLILLFQSMMSVQCVSCTHELHIYDIFHSTQFMGKTQPFCCRLYH